MGKEIERKFLVKDDSWKKSGNAVLFRQGYLSLNPHCVVRVRIEGEQGMLTLKGAPHGLTREEFNYPIALKDAEKILETLVDSPVIVKWRTRVAYGKHVWEIDEFLGENEGLIVAEIELSREDEEFMIPDWIDREVTHDPRYSNSSLARHPFSAWRQ